MVRFPPYSDDTRSIVKIAAFLSPWEPTPPTHHLAFRILPNFSPPTSTPAMTVVVKSHQVGDMEVDQRHLSPDAAWLRCTLFVFACDVTTASARPTSFDISRLGDGALVRSLWCTAAGCAVLPTGPARISAMDARAACRWRTSG